MLFIKIIQKKKQHPLQPRAGHGPECAILQSCVILQSSSTETSGSSSWESTAFLWFALFGAQQPRCHQSGGAPAWCAVVEFAIPAAATNGLLVKNAMNSPSRAMPATHRPHNGTTDRGTNAKARLTAPTSAQCGMAVRTWSAMSHPTARDARTEQSAIGEQQFPKAHPEKIPPLTQATIILASSASAESVTASGMQSGKRIPYSSTRNQRDTSNSSRRISCPNGAPSQEMQEFGHQPKRAQLVDKEPTIVPIALPVANATTIDSSSATG